MGIGIDKNGDELNDSLVFYLSRFIKRNKLGRVGKLFLIKNRP